MHREKLEKAARAYRRAEATLELRRVDLADVIAEVTGDLSQAEIVQITGYTRETVRRIQRNASRMGPDPW